MKKKGVPDSLPDPSDLMLAGEYDRGYKLTMRIIKLIDDDALTGRYATLGALDFAKLVLMRRWMEEDQEDDA